MWHDAEKFKMASQTRQNKKKTRRKTKKVLGSDIGLVRLDKVQELTLKLPCQFGTKYSVPYGSIQKWRVGRLGTVTL